MQALVQLSGINPVTFFSGDIFEKAGQEALREELSIVLQLVGLVGTGLGCVLVDRFGRRPLLLASTGSMTLCLLALTLALAFDGSVPRWFPVAAVLTYVAAFTVGAGPLPWLIVGEIFPLNIRSKAASLCTASSWASSYLATQSFRWLTQSLGNAGTFALYAGFAAIFCVFVYELLPETKGQPL
eukprot:SAG31_NODE_18837_length_621_cov_0.819923_1_plen_183_part_01